LEPYTITIVNLTNVTFVMLANRNFYNKNFNLDTYYCSANYCSSSDHISDVTEETYSDSRNPDHTLSDISRMSCRRIYN